MPRSGADRPYGSFRRTSDAESAGAPPPRPTRRFADRLDAFRRRTRTAQLVAASAALAVAATSLLGSLTPAAPRVTAADVERAVTAALASATAKPNVTIDAYEHVRRSVVLVKTRRVGDEATQARASGVLLDTGGRIVTSLHVVRDALDIVVVFFDGTEVPAALAAADPESDIGLLEAAGIGQLPAVLASPKSLRVGDEAILVGSPLGLRNSLSAGVVSALGRTVQPPWSAVPLEGLIQFDAAIAPGNAGGPLVNRRGEVIAIVIGAATSGGADLPNIGFAVPINALAKAAGFTPF